MSARTAAAASSATSSPNITQQDNVIYSTTYVTVNWNGQMTAQYINPADGAVLPTMLWSAQATLDGRVADTTRFKDHLHLRRHGRESLETV